jgi:tetratricopeptide (TPR) repeat protein
MLHDPLDPMHGVAYFNRGNAEQAEGDYDGAVVDYNEALRVDPKLGSAAIQRVFALERLVKRSASNTTTQANITALVSTSENEIAKSQLESKSCGDKLAVYVADGLTKVEGARDLIEIAFDNNISYSENIDQRAEFLIRKYRNNNLEWIYKGKHIQRHFVFTPENSKYENNFLKSMFTSAHSSRKKSVVLALNHVKPNRDGTGEPILYLSGLRALFASKENRFKFEGKRPSEFLPEAFYFDRCE